MLLWSTDKVFILQVPVYFGTCSRRIMLMIIKDSIVKTAFRFARKMSLITLAFSCVPVYAFNLNKEIDTIDEPLEKKTLFIPYGFYNESTGVAAAFVVLTESYIQPQMTTLANVFAGSNGSSNLFISTLDTHVPGFNRLFLDTKFMVARWGETDSYQNGNPSFAGEQAGSNDSDEDNFISVDGADNYFRLKFRYLLPIGDGEKDIVHTFALNKGLLVKGYEAGGREWNPFISGRTTLELEPFYRSQKFQDDQNIEYDGITSGVRINIEYDNTDWYKNPSYGSRQSFSVSRDWGLEEKSNTWASMEFEYSKFVPLSLDKNTRQRVLAFNFWTSDVPTWDSSHIDSKTGSEIFHRAPNFAGSTLGGLNRQRGFSSDRFSDRSAINYAVEYRKSPTHNPFPKIPLINKLHIPWWEWIMFMEVGRVADKWSLSDLHENMKVSVGAGIRLQVEGLIIRVDGAASEEGASAQMFFGHTF
jgi:hypothetical protein